MYSGFSWITPGSQSFSRVIVFMCSFCGGGVELAVLRLSLRICLDSGMFYFPALGWLSLITAPLGSIVH